MSKKIRSIHYKLALLFALCTVIGIALSSLGTFLYTSHQIRDESLNALAEVADLMRNTMVAAMEFEDLESINATLDSVQNNPNIQALFVYNARQKLIASHIREGTEEHKLRALVQEQSIANTLTKAFNFRNRSFLLVSRPVMSEGEYTGTLTVVGSTERLQSSLYFLMFMQFIAGLVALGLVLLLAVRMQKTFTLPIFKLREAMQAFSHNPDADARVQHDSGDEFDSLFDGYHYMLDVIKDRNRELAFQRAALDEHAIVTTIDAQGMITQCNDTFCSISGYTQEELIGEDYHRFLSDAHPESFYQGIYEVVRNGHVWRGEINSKKKDGSYYWVSASIVPFMNEQGEPFKYIAVRSDITARKQAVEAMRQARELAEASTRSKSEFLSRMSHEIRTPMNAIIGMTHLALQTDLDEKQHDYLIKSQGAAQSLLSLINDILDFSKIEAGKLEMEHVSFDLDQVLDNLATMTGLSSEAKGLEIYFSVEPDVPLHLLGDPLRLGQVLLNLCNNASKFTDKGEILVHVRAVAPIAEQAMLEFTVQDSGIGMTAEQLDSLFQSFNQADVSITRKYGGTGLGLAISKQLVELMGGQISVESAVGRGSRFIFTAAFDVDKHSHKPSIQTLDDLRGMHVLVVDDSETSLKIMRQYLECYAFRVDVAQSGADAINMLKSQTDSPYQLIFMDWNMPGRDGTGMNGIETARRIRGLSGSVPLPTIIMVTAHARDEVMAEAGDEGFDGFLTKPVNQSSLMDTVIATLSQDHKAVTRNGVKPSHPDVDLHDVRVLVAEDNEINQQIAREVLERAGCVVTVVSNGQEAVDAVRQSPFDVVLMDLQMPVMDGYTATDLIRQDARFDNLPIIAMTAHAMVEEQERCREHGMNGHASKPINVKELLEQLQQCVGARDGITAPEHTPSQTTSASLLPPSLPGIDLPAALKMLGGNDLLLRNVLKKFYHGYTDAQAVLTMLLQQQDWRAVEEWTHDLKGTSGNISAPALFQSATCLNEAVRRVMKDPEDHPTVAEEAVEQLLKDLDEVLTGIELEVK